MNIIAVDPGLSGGIAHRHSDQPALANRMPSTEGDLVYLLRDLVSDPATTVAIVEQVGGYVGKAQPASSAFKFGQNYGFVLGVLQALAVRIELVRPQKWQKALSLGLASDCVSRAAWKAKLRAHAQRLYPGVKVTLATADALLLLEYARLSQSTR